MGCMIGGMMESRIGMTAAAHCGSSRGVFRFFDLDANKDHAEDPIIGGLRFQDGRVHLPEAPGLGASPDPAFLRGIPSVVVE